MNIGIVTVYDSDNCGAFLQAYAMYKELKNQGNSVFFVKLRSEEERKATYLRRNPGLKGLLVHLYKKRFNQEKYDLMKKDIDSLPYIDLEDENKMKTLDCLVLGSDEIWNVKTKSFKKNIFYGANKYDIPSLAFAVCAGQSKAEDFEQYPEIKEAIKNVYKVAARDVNTLEVANSLRNEENLLVTDPTLIVDPEVFNHEYNGKLNKPYMVVYSYQVSKTKKEYLKKYAKENNLQLVAVCTKQGFCDKSINCSPLEFSQIMRGADCVYTTTFHGTIFSLLNHKRLVVDTANFKVLDLLRRYEMDSIRISADASYDEFSKKMKENPNYDNFERVHTELREKCTGILANCLDEIKTAIESEKQSA